ncbi:MAG: peroxiredoxin [Gammaproteobacteria bacterium]|nr:peroxiredoxin [Gammaproteobacteria bacterium]
MIKVGDRVPDNISLQYMDGKRVKDISSGELFSKGRVVLFAVPGAFTPACSEQHLPGYVSHSYDLRQKGIDDIVCIAVNDAFVMNAWAKDNNIVDEVRFIADGNGDFARAIGVNMDMTRFGLGERSMRYSMLIEDGIVTILNMENGGAFDVSKAEKILDAI